MQFYPSSIGIDISSASIKAVSLKKGEGDEFNLAAFGKEYLPAEVLVDGEIKDYGGFAKALESVLENKEFAFPKTKYFVVSLPEEKAFLRILELPSSLKKEEFENALKFEIEANIPVSLDEVYYDHEILKHPHPSGNYIDVMVNAIPKRIVDSYVNFFKKYGFQPLAFEIESVATKRALFPCCDSSIKETVLVLDIGASRTCFMIVSEEMLRFTSSNSVAGDTFSKTLSEHFPMNLKEAEFMKRVVGLDNNQEKGKELLEVLRPSLVMVKEQIQNYIEFFENHPTKDNFSDEAKKVSKIILTGGGATLWGIKDWISQELGLPVIFGNPLGKIKESRDSKTRMSLEDSLAYSTAVGLAMRNFIEMEK